ncbi:hypothetical protein FOA52_000873 [Chlamydomonas sp. UWO 241]|nr:hypothetical protein FOA52_000873 [Chlamydomonas sp. UWO 241]
MRVCVDGIRAGQQNDARCSPQARHARDAHQRHADERTAAGAAHLRSLPLHAVRRRSPPPQGTVQLYKFSTSARGGGITPVTCESGSYLKSDMRILRARHGFFGWLDLCGEVHSLVHGGKCDRDSG